MDPYKTHGAFSWNELLTRDPDAALEFYRKLFGWTSEPMQMPAGVYHVVKANGSAVGGIMSMPKTAAAGGMPPMWGSYVTVDDVDAAATKAVELGARVVHGPEDIPNVGRIVVIVDPQGAAINLITYRMP
jgi:predicted enzyme related to lactoylglutathione lyase